MDQALYDLIQKLQAASFFRTRHGDTDRIVNAPFLGSPIASAFERLTQFGDSVLEVGRLGVHEVHEVCCGLDLAQEDASAIDMLKTWKLEGSITVRRMSGGRC